MVTLVHTERTWGSGGVRILTAGESPTEWALEVFKKLTRHLRDRRLHDYDQE